MKRTDCFKFEKRSFDWGGEPTPMSVWVCHILRSPIRQSIIDSGNRYQDLDCNLSDFRICQLTGKLASHLIHIKKISDETYPFAKPTQKISKIRHHFDMTRLPGEIIQETTNFFQILVEDS